MSASPTPPERPPLPPSPCVGICALQGEHCYGCGRTSDEIAAWGSLSPSAQSAVWAQLPGRLAAFGFRTFRLAAGPAVVGEFIGRTFREATGRWRIVSAAVEAEMAITAAARPQFSEDERRLTAIGQDGDIITLAKHDRVRIFGFAGDDGDNAMNSVALVLPKGLAHRAAQEQQLQWSGSDNAIDLGLPNLYAGAALSVWNHQPSAAVAALSNADWAEARHRLPDILRTMTATFVLRNALGQIQTYAPSIQSADTAPEDNAPANVKISRAYVACAIFHADDPEWLAATLAP